MKNLPRKAFLSERGDGLMMCGDYIRQAEESRVANIRRGGWSIAP